MGFVRVVRQNAQVFGAERKNITKFQVFKSTVCPSFFCISFFQSTPYRGLRVNEGHHDDHSQSIKFSFALEDVKKVRNFIMIVFFCFFRSPTHRLSEVSDPILSYWDKVFDLNDFERNFLNFAENGSLYRFDFNSS